MVSLGADVNQGCERVVPGGAAANVACRNVTICAHASAAAAAVDSGSPPRAMTVFELASTKVLTVAGRLGKGM